MSDASDPQPPPHLPPDREGFFRAGADMELLSAVTPAEPGRHVLEQLGPPPFRKTSFPMMGFLASMYEQVAAHVAGRETSAANPPAA
jgi:hypothetical protein